MFIAKLEIKNFQCHRHLTLNFSEGVNAITGESDQGKSAIVRALRWLIHNKPDGQQYRKHGTKETLVSATLSTGLTVTRVRSNTINRYVIEVSNKEAEVYDNFGKAIPKRVSTVLGIKAAKFTDDIIEELSISNQFDGPFLLNNSGIVKAQILGKLSKTSIIDTAVKQIGTDVRASGRHLNMVKKDLEGLEHEKKRFSNLDKQVKQLEKIEKLAETTRLRGQRIEVGIKTAEDLIEIKGVIAERTIAIERLSNLPDIENLENRGIGLNRLIEIDDRIKEIEKRLPRFDVAIEKIKAIEPRFIIEFDNAGAKLKEAIDFQRRTAEWKDRYQTTHRKIAECQENLGQHIKQMLMIIRREGRCPTCLREVDDMTIDRISKELMPDRERL